MFPHLITRRLYLVQKRTTERLKNSGTFYKGLDLKNDGLKG